MRREARAAITAGIGVVVLSVLLGIGWGLLAPAERLLVVSEGRGAPLTGESMHRFDALALFLCAGAGLGTVSAAAVWRARPVRGPIVLAGLLLGSVVGACLMAVAGEFVARVRNPRPDDPAVGQLVTLPATVDAWQALLVQPLVALLIVLFCAALSSAEDLGTGYLGAFGARRPLADERHGSAEPYPPWTGGTPGAVGPGGYEPYPAVPPPYRGAAPSRPGPAED